MKLALVMATWFTITMVGTYVYNAPHWKCVANYNVPLCMK